MADQIQTDANGKVYKNGVLQANSSPATPGVGGAISDAVAALAKAFGPRSITQRGQKVKDAIDRDETGQPDALGNQF